MDILYGQINYSFFDSYWALVHFCSGLLLGLLIVYLTRTVDKKRYYYIGIGLLVLWEIFEGLLRILNKYFIDMAESLQSVIPSNFFLTESVINITSDLILGSLGLTIIYAIFLRRFEKRINYEN
ncbi:hypothetical protein KKG41_00580 [Patescibacteria group bacterium]|nr:hypothetical protein [Patescibacteria group bacterium]